MCPGRRDVGVEGADGDRDCSYALVAKARV